MGSCQREVRYGVWTTSASKLWRSEVSSSRAISHEVGIPHAEVWRSPIS